MASILAMLKDPRMWLALGLSAMCARAAARGLARFLYPQFELKRRILSLALWVCLSAAPLFMLPTALRSSLVYLLLPWKYATLSVIYIKDPFFSVWITFLLRCAGGVPLCFVLADNLAVFGERLSDARVLKTPPLFWFTAIGVFYLAMAVDPVYGLILPFKVPRFFGFGICAAATSAEIGLAFYALENDRTPMPDLAASCLFAAAAAMNSPAAAAVLLPLLPIRLHYLPAEADTDTSVEDEQYDRLAELHEQIVSLRRIINRAHAGAGRVAAPGARRVVIPGAGRVVVPNTERVVVPGSEFWLLPPDREALQRMVNDGTLILPETANDENSLDIYIEGDMGLSQSESG